MTKHTEGPWHVGMKPGPMIYGSKGEQVADLTARLLPDDETTGNARLIAAAPDLLAALQAIADAESAGSAYPGDGWRLAHEKLCGYARAAIAKAAQSNIQF